MTKSGFTDVLYLVIRLLVLLLTQSTSYLSGEFFSLSLSLPPIYSHIIFYTPMNSCVLPWASWCPPSPDPAAGSSRERGTYPSLHLLLSIFHTTCNFLTSHLVATANTSSILRPPMTTRSVCGGREGRGIYHRRRRGFLPWWWSGPCFDVFWECRTRVRSRMRYIEMARSLFSIYFDYCPSWKDTTVHTEKRYYMSTYIFVFHSLGL